MWWRSSKSAARRWWSKVDIVLQNPPKETGESISRHARPKNKSAFLLGETSAQEHSRAAFCGRILQQAWDYGMYTHKGEISPHALTAEKKSVDP
jgi:hypothetical protein